MEVCHHVADQARTAKGRSGTNVTPTPQPPGSKSLEQCEKLSQLLFSKNNQVKKTMLDLFHQASSDENESYTEKVKQVAKGEKPVSGDPFDLIQESEIEERWRKS